MGEEDLYLKKTETHLATLKESMHLSVECRSLTNFVRRTFTDLLKGLLNMCIFNWAFTGFMCLGVPFTSFSLRFFFTSHL